MLLTLDSCQESEIDFLSSKKEYTSVNSVPFSNKVSLEDVALLLKGESGGTRSNVDIDCIRDQDNDTLLYVYNKPAGGWILFSSDSRVPAIVAESDCGSFYELKENESTNVWIQSLANDMKQIKTLDDSKLNFSSSEINSNRQFWIRDSILIESSFSKNNLASQVSINGNKDLPPIQIPRGHYEYSYSVIVTETYDSIPRLTMTNWDQESPYNNNCPFKSNSNVSRAPAGCVAIAAAQMLYFFHEKYGVPRTAPSKAYCYGHVGDKDYNWAQTDYTSEVWDDMKIYGEAAAPLIADIGRRIKMKYGDEGSEAAGKDLVSKVFEPYGISASYSDYDTELIKDNLKNGLPVLLIAYTHNPDNNSILVGHDFIADRYKRTRAKRISYYRWVYDYVPENTFIPYIHDKEEVEYLSPVINMIGMNWGWGSYLNNSSEWYALTGDWIKEYDKIYNLNINRKMIYVNSINLTNN